MKRLLTFTILLFWVIFAWCTKLNTSPTVPAGDIWVNKNADSTESKKESTITQLNVYQVLLEWSEVDFSWAKMLIGCNDWLVALPVKVNISESAKYIETWKLLQSFNVEEKWFTNPRKWQDAISFSSYEIQWKNLIIKLSGNLKIEWVCDIPRLEESLKATYKAFWFDTVTLLVNGMAISQQ